MEVVRKRDYFREKELVAMNRSVYLPGLHNVHTHDFLEITFVTHGEGYHFFGDEKKRVRKGDLFFINFTNTHYYEPLTDDFRWINCLFLPEALDPSLINSSNAEDILRFTLFRYLFPADIPGINELQHTHHVDEFSRLFDDMDYEYNEAKAGYQDVLRHYLYILLIRIFRGYAAASDGNTGNCEHEAIRKVVQYIQDNCGKLLKLEDIARQAFLAPAYLSSLFKKETGHNITDYIHQFRIRKACELLCKTDWPVNTIMREVGYQDSKFFYEIFKRHTGATPGNYRRDNVI